MRAISNLRMKPEHMYLLEAASNRIRFFGQQQKDIDEGAVTQLVEAIQTQLGGGTIDSTIQNLLRETAEMTQANLQALGNEMHNVRKFNNVTTHTDIIKKVLGGDFYRFFCHDSTHLLEGLMILSDNYRRVSQGKSASREVYARFILNSPDTLHRHISKVRNCIGNSWELVRLEIEKLNDIQPALSEVNLYEVLKDVAVVTGLRFGADFVENAARNPPSQRCIIFEGDKVTIPGNESYFWSIFYNNIKNTFTKMMKEINKPEIESRVIMHDYPEYIT